MEIYEFIGFEAGFGKMADNIDMTEGCPICEVKIIEN